LDCPENKNRTVLFYKHLKKYCLLFFLIFSAFNLFARDIEITVEDTELGLPLEGAVIRSWDGKQYTTDKNGKVLVAVPNDRQVLVHAAYPGYENSRQTITVSQNTYTIGLRLIGIMEGRELVIEAARPGSADSKTGRSVAVSEREIAQTAEIGIVEDVMNSIKLLPGVGYAGFFNAQPSIRGGDPGDMKASLDGFYIMNPYHWGGGFSIFDPRMVQSAQLSHGVFSSRYGHTISGLLDITTKEPSSVESEFELGMSTSAASVSLSLPIMGRGGILFMGRITYYDPFIWFAKQLSQTIEELAIVNSIRIAPYIRSGTVTGNYRFNDKLELRATGFWGMDGVGATFENGSSAASEFTSSSKTVFDWTNYQGFITAGLSWNPGNTMLLKFTAGTGYEDALVDGDMKFDITGKTFSDDFDYWKTLLTGYINNDAYDFYSRDRFREDTKMFNIQGRVDYDWELGSGLLAAAGIQEKFTGFIQKSDDFITFENWFNDMNTTDRDNIKAVLGNEFLYYNYLRIQYPSAYIAGLNNKIFTTSAYILGEYNPPDKRFGGELGLRMDHYYLLGKDFSIPFTPTLNPRINVDFNILKNRGIVHSLDISAGTGLFSTVDDVVFMAEKKFDIKTGKQGRSWTSVLGIKTDLQDNITVNIEGYYKNIYNRIYVPIDATGTGINPRPKMDGEGRVWGIDAMVQKFQSRFWDGWLSYSYNWANYRDPNSGNPDIGFSGGTQGEDWYFPSYHRFHNLNLVLNIKPVRQFNIYTRFGIASGVQISKRNERGPQSWPVYVYDPDTGSAYFIEKFYWFSESGEKIRTTPSFPLDIKFSIFGKNSEGKTRYEVYFAIENILALLYSARGNTGYNQYTGDVMTGSNSASYEIPIPVPSFGFKYSY